jgi:cytochrome c peroxidase
VRNSRDLSSQRGWIQARPAAVDDPVPELKQSGPVGPQYRRRALVTFGSVSRLFAGVAAAMATGMLCTGCLDSADSEIMVLDTQQSAEVAPSERGVSLAYANEELSPRVLRRFAPLEPSAAPANKELADLGRKLYYDPRLSKTGAVSCNTCHPLAQYGTTPTTVSTGILGRKGQRNAPSTYNAAGHFAQLWDGRSPSVEKQAVMPLENKDEMGMTAADVIAAVAQVADYRLEFAQVFPKTEQPVSIEHIGLAIGAFEHGLVTPARWDRYLRGEQSVLNAEEKAGAKLFANLGCIVCHTGPYVGGSMFERLGARVPWPASRDRGRKEVTGAVADDMVFKVPSLRNVAKTAPYFHDGSVATLNQAVRMMARHQLGIELDDSEARELEAWLGSLTGDIPMDYIAPPKMPAGV